MQIIYVQFQKYIRTSQITIISGNSILESAMGPFISKLSFVQSVISFITGIVQTSWTVNKCGVTVRAFRCLVN